MATTLEAAVRNLVAQQGADPMNDGAPCWEGETVWNAMLPCQYALAFHVMERPLPEGHRERILKQLEVTRLPSGRWGLSPHSPDSLFVTTLAYVTARVLGVDADDRLLREARTMFTEGEGVLAIPTWGKAWLALCNLYSWEGVHAVPPEVWLLPKALPIHPANYYCHTRLIYMGMASVSGRKLQARRTALVDALREELFPRREWDGIDWPSARGMLREGDLWAPPSAPLKAAYTALDAFEGVHPKGVRRKMLAKVREDMRWELRASDHTALSPVNGLLFMLSLWAEDPEDADLQKQLDRFSGWIWEDDAEGLRVAGARSATWDTSFVLQALAVAHRAGVKVEQPLLDGLRWLETQQIQETLEGWEAHDRVDPRGGFCFAGVWHGWPVSDCTAEAMLAFLEAPEELYTPDPDAMWRAMKFLLQCQNADGGFGSYERRKTPVSLEWMNPAEMFGDSMTEASYYECTSSCLQALCAFAERYPAWRSEVSGAIARAAAYLRASQNEDGSWDGAWGVSFLYGTLFGVKGLLAAGASRRDPALRRACEFVKARQREDGGWGEDPQTALTGEYIELGHAHATQTAWALMTLLSAADEDDDDEAIGRGIVALEALQSEGGDWPEQEMAGVFFRTAFLDYRLYRRFFPTWAIGLNAVREQSLGRDPDRRVERVLERVTVA